MAKQLQPPPVDYLLYMRESKGVRTSSLLAKWNHWSPSIWRDRDLENDHRRTESQWTLRVGDMVPT